MPIVQGIEVSSERKTILRELKSNRSGGSFQNFHHNDRLRFELPEL